MTDRARQLESSTALDVQTTNVEGWKDLGSDSVRGLVAAFELKTLVGGVSPGVTPVLEHSPDQVAIFTLDDTFAQITVAGNGVQFRESAPCFRYVRWSWTTAGSPTSATADTFHEA